MSGPVIRGVCPIVATPFDEEGAVDYDSLENEVRRLARDGCHAAALFGLASEFYKLSDRERERMVDVVTETADRHGLPLVISVTHESTEVAVRWAREYEDAGADCLMVYLPSVRNPSASGIYDHLVAIGETVDLPVMVQYTDDDASIAPGTFARLMEEVPNVNHFKIECTPPGPFVDELLDRTDGEANVLVGAAGTRMVECFERGATGVMPAAIFNELYVEIYEALQAGDRDRALEIHGDLLPMLNHVGQAPIRHEKRLLSKRGIVETDYCRRPLDVPTDEVYEDLLEEYYDRLEPHLR